MHDHHQKCRKAANEASRARDERASLISQEIVASLPTLAQRTLSRVVKGSAPGWLTVLPLRQEGYDLTSTQFRDQLAIRYGHQPGRLPSLCDGCGVSFTLQHVLDCPKGGLIKRGHKLTMTSETTTQSWQISHGQESLSSRCSFLPMIATPDPHFRPTGPHLVSGRVTGWHCLITAS